MREEEIDVTDIEIPDVDDTDLSREELEEVAADCGVDPEGLDDQELLERLGVALGEFDESQLEEARRQRSATGSTDETRERGGDPEEDVRTVDALRAKVATALSAAAARVTPRGESSDDDADGVGRAGGGRSARGAGATQSAPGEPVDGPTRDELRDELRALGLPVTGTKDELLDRLEEARGGSGGEVAADGPGAGSEEEPTRDELRDELRERGLAVTGTKDELQQRLAEAEGGSASPDDAEERTGQAALAKVRAQFSGRHDADASSASDADDGLRAKLRRRLHLTRGPADDDGDGPTASEEDHEPSADTSNQGDAPPPGQQSDDDHRLRDRAADKLDALADRLRGSGDGQGPPAGEAATAVTSKLKRVGAAAKQRLPGG